MAADAWLRMRGCGCEREHTWPMIPADDNRAEAKLLVPQHFANLKVDPTSVRLGDAAHDGLLALCVQLTYDAETAECVVRSLMHLLCCGQRSALPPCLAHHLLQSHLLPRLVPLD